MLVKRGFALFVYLYYLCICMCAHLAPSQNRHPRHEFVPPLLRRVLVRPVQQGVVIHALVDRTPAWPGFCLTFERRVAGAHQGLPDVVEAVRGVVGDFLGEVRAAVALLEVAD